MKNHEVHCINVALAANAASLEKRAGLLTQIAQRAANKVRAIATGRARVYHGTSEERAKKILEEGIKPGVRGGISEAYTGLPKLNKGLVFTSRSKGAAKFYAASQSLRDSAKSLDAAGKPIQADMARWLSIRLPASIPGVYEVQRVRGKAKILSADIPVWSRKAIRRLAKNPESIRGVTVKLTREKVQGAPRFVRKGIAKVFNLPSAIDAEIIHKGRIPASKIHQSLKYKKPSSEAAKAYRKALRERPKETLKRVLKHG